MTRPPEPKPCPFCGGTNLTLPDMLAGVFDDTFVTCQDCDAIGPSTPSKATAIEAWNDRAGEAAITKHAVDLISGGCDKHVDLSFDAFVEAGGGGCPVCLQAEANQLVDERVREYQRRLWADGLDGAEVTHYGPHGARKEKLS